MREYQSQTQLFLESLPISRGRMIAVKYLLGLFLIFATVGLVFLSIVVITQREEALTGRFLAIMAARAVAYSWCLYAFFFFMGLMGRYRVALYLVGVGVFCAFEAAGKKGVPVFSIISGPVAQGGTQF